MGTKSPPLPPITSDSSLGIESPPLPIVHLSSPIYISGNWVRTKSLPLTKIISDSWVGTKSPTLSIIILYFRQLSGNKISDITHHNFIFQAIEWEQNLLHYPSSFSISGNWVGTKSPTLPIIILYFRQLSGKKSPTLPIIILYIRQLSGNKIPDNTHHHFIFQAIKWEQNPRHHPWSTQNFSLAQVRKENIKRNNRRQN